MEECKDSVTSLDISDHEILVGSADSSRTEIVSTGLTRMKKKQNSSFSEMTESSTNPDPVSNTPPGKNSVSNVDKILKIFL